jgi:hypothetical protein
MVQYGSDGLIDSFFILTTTTLNIHRNIPIRLLAASQPPRARQIRRAETRTKCCCRSISRPTKQTEERGEFRTFLAQIEHRKTRRCYVKSYRKTPGTSTIAAGWKQQPRELWGSTIDQTRTHFDSNRNRKYRYNPKSHHGSARNPKTYSWVE